jgi:hypothetical protein
MGVLILSLRGGNGVRDAAIHRVSRDTVYGCGTVTMLQWIATPAGAGDDKSGVGA